LALELGLPGWDADDLNADEPDDLSGYLDTAEERDELDEAAAYIVRFATQLSHDEQVLLLASIDDGTPLKISYTNAGGESSVRVIEPLGLDNHRLVAWCTLRDEERMFSLDRIHAVSPA
jgi:predicted DNA-binding transcriptional regulator YafY